MSAPGGSRNGGGGGGGGGGNGNNRRPVSSSSSSRDDHTSIPLRQLDKDWFDVFQQLGPDKNDEILLSDLKRKLTANGASHGIPPDSIDLILTKADQDENGKLSYMEFLDMAVAEEYKLQDRPVIRRALWTTAYAVVPRNERSKWEKSYLDEHTCQIPPVFMLAISVIEIVIFIYHTYGLVQERGWTIGINGPAPITSILIYDPYRRYQAWRFATYMFVHSGFMHIIVNVIIQLLLGIPLEMVHKWWRVLLVYFAGVIAGSLGTSITDPNTFLAGASGGVYALMAAHLASIIINWSEMEFAWFRLAFFLILGGSDLGVAIYYRLTNVETNVGYVAHLAGAIAGLLVGIKVLRNLRPLKWENYIWWISLALFIILMTTAIAWNIFYPSWFPEPKWYSAGENKINSMQ